MHRRESSVRLAALIAAGLAAIAIPAPAGAQPHSAEHADGRGIRASETVALGPEHAAEHAAMRRAGRREQGRWRAMGSGRRLLTARREAAAAERYAAKTAGHKREAGAWTEAPFELPNYAINAVMLPTGKVLFWGPPAGLADNTADVTIWDPALGYGPGAFESAPAPQVDPDGDGPQGMVAAPIYCAGQSLMASGEVLVTGGNLLWPDQSDEYESFGGLDRVFTFDPFTETWQQQPAMADGRWYPSQALLGDGRTVVAGGYPSAAPGAQFTDEVEVFSPGDTPGATGEIDQLAEAPRGTSLYPHLFTLPSGEVLLGGPGPYDSALLRIPPEGDSSPTSWQDLPSAGQYRVGGTAVIELGPEPGAARVTQIGGWGDPQLEDGSHYAVRTTTTLDADRPGDGWSPPSEGPKLRIGRSYHNTVVLPDRSLVTVGGGLGRSAAGSDFVVDEEGTRRRVELFDPDTGHWRLGPAQIEDRAYHSTAILLPDGRVWSAGDNFHGPEPGPDGFSTKDTAEIYSPPYLFQGKRPKLTTAPAQLGWAEQFDVSTEGRDARRAVLVAPGATTHAADMQQRLVPLTLSSRSEEGLSLLSPPDANVAPPGYYMLFALARGGVPSKARWVQLG